MGHVPYDHILTTPEQRARGIIDLVLRLQDHMTCQELEAIVALAVTFLDDPRSVYAEMPMRVTGHHVDYFRPLEFRPWVFVHRCPEPHSCDDPRCWP